MKRFELSAGTKPLRPESSVVVTAVLRAVAEEAGVDPAAVLGRYGSEVVADARRVVCYLCHVNLGLRTVEIAKALGDRHPDGVKIIYWRVEDASEDPAYDERLSRLEELTAPLRDVLSSDTRPRLDS